jgi:hypothetical protein
LSAEIESFREAIDFIVNGKLSTLLVPTENLKLAITQLESFLNEKGNYYIIHKDENFYYTHGKFWITRKANQLIISLSCPLSMTSQGFVLYELTPFPLEVHNNPGYFSILSESFTGILYNPNEACYCSCRSST